MLAFLLLLLPFMSFESESDGKTLQWKKVTEIEGFHRAFHTCNFVNGSRIIMIGGKNGQVIHNEFRVLDMNSMKTLNLKVKKPKNHYRFGHTTTNYKDKLVLIGGKSSDESFQERIFHIASNLQRVITYYPPFKTFGKSDIVQDNFIMLFGGKSVYVSMKEFGSNRILTYNLNNHSMSIKQFKNNPPPPMEGNTAIVSYDKMYVFGGFNKKQMISNIWIFNFISNSWKEIKPSLMEGTNNTRAFSRAELINKNEVLLFGGLRYLGDDKWVDLNDTIIYDIPNNSFRTLDVGNVITSRYGHCVFKYEGNILIHGGKSKIKGKTYNDMFVLPLNSSSTFFKKKDKSEKKEKQEELESKSVINLELIKELNQKIYELEEELNNKRNEIKSSDVRTSSSFPNMFYICNAFSLVVIVSLLIVIRNLKMKIKNLIIEVRNLITEVRNLKTELNTKDERIKNDIAELLLKDKEIDVLQRMNIQLSSLQ